MRVRHFARAVLTAILAGFWTVVPVASAQDQPAINQVEPVITEEHLEQRSDSGRGVSEIQGNFTALRDERAILLTLIPNLRAERDQKSNELRALEAEEARLNDSLRFARPPGVKSSEMVRLEGDVQRVARELKRAEDLLVAARNKDPIEEGEAEFLQSKIEDLKSEGAYAEARLQEFVTLEASGMQDSDAIKERIAQIGERKKQLQEQIRSVEVSLREALDNQSQIENAINLLLIPQTAENLFKLWITGAFAALVGVVILGFFFMSHRDEKVRQAIFSGQAGIQFLTLFSLVIAIILFGMTGILEGKELSALLGGLSGYILGRVTAEKTA